MPRKKQNTFCAFALSLIAGLVISGCSYPSSAQTVEQAPTALPNTGAGAFLPLIINDPTPEPEPTALATLEPTVQPTVPVTLPVTTPVTQTDTVFGIEMEDVFYGGQMLADMGTTWVRRNALLWSAVEPIEGARNWSNVNRFERELVEASRLGMKIILIVRSTPAWAQKYAGSECGPVRSNKMAAFGRFMGDLVARYSKAPYNVKYFEIWNEPDAPVATGSPVWGCWGERNDAYYGGRYYAEALKAAYPQMKAADPESQVLIGGLLLNREGDVQSRFFEGILVAGGAPFFDGVSYHTYDYYYSGIGGFGTPNWPSSSSTTGPLLIVKSRFLKSVMQKYNVTGKYIINTELAVICDACGTNGGGQTNNANYETTKAYYMAQGMAAAMAEGHKAITWYSLGGWFGSALWDGAKPKPALIAFSVGRRLIGGAEYLGEITQADVNATGVAGYKFKRGNTDVWLVWARDGRSKRLTFERMPMAITDALGARFEPVQSLAINIKPVYIEFSNP
jgi:hypothetical protein